VTDDSADKIKFEDSRPSYTFALALLDNTVPSIFVKQQVVSSCALKHFIIDEDYSRPS
jgi:hypothetical protein